MATPMNMAGKSLFLAALVLVSGAGFDAAAAQRRPRVDQQAAHQGRAEGRLLPSREIERRVVPQMKGAEYLGFDFDSGTAIYTLKFLRDGNVIWVDVDARSGRILGRTGR
ncbi:PepSY domain-containing protein [Sphingomonas sp. FW199]|uniref:PepSY domain-containing protein n=1 Tax=Sphingomonas sp. FW199 TaxID=3400217 RepID=UPI003CF0FB2F